MKKRRHHYVWQHYLRAWATDGQIACKRGERVFSTQTANVALVKDFYRLRELTPDDLAIVEGLAAKATPLLQKLHQGWIESFTIISELHKRASDAGVVSGELERELDVALNNLEEELHAGIESMSIPYLDALRREDTSFLLSGPEFGDFSYYLAVQYMRTRKMRETVVAALPEYKGFSAERAWGVLSHICATNVGYGLLVDRANHRVWLLRADAPAEFLTSDQPVVNLAAHGKAIDEQVEELDLYYPVSPSLALRIEAGRGDGAVSLRTLEREEVDEYNARLRWFSHEQMFASDERRLMETADSGAK